MRVSGPCRGGLGASHLYEEMLPTLSTYVRCVAAAKKLVCVNCNRISRSNSSGTSVNGETSKDSGLIARLD